MLPKYGNWEIVKEIGSGSFGTVYEIRREDFGVVTRAALKVISIPPNQNEVTIIRSQGMSEESVTDYFKGIAEDVVKEFELMSKLKGITNIVSYEDHQIQPHENGIGWNILIRMELLTPLDSYLLEHPITRQGVIQLGIDLCRALERCQKSNIIHRDIKPGNIFVSDQGDFKLGDFGIARTVERTMSNMSRKGTYTYMAPEVYKGAGYSYSVDIYSLGIVMYQLLNNRRAPFMPPYPEQIRYRDQEQALVRRMSGEKLPPPCLDNGRLAEIVLKACSYDPKDRYSSPMQMREELEALRDNRGEQSAGNWKRKQPEKRDQVTSSESKEKRQDGEKKKGVRRGLLLLGVVAAAIAVVCLWQAQIKSASSVFAAADMEMVQETESGQGEAGSDLQEAAQIENESANTEDVVTENGPIDGVARVGENSYETLQEAIESANGETVYLLKDTAEDIYVSSGEVTLCLEGHILTNQSGDTITVKQGATLTIEGEGTVDNLTDRMAAVYNNGTVILNGGTYTRSMENGRERTADSESQPDAYYNSFYILLNHGEMEINEGVQVIQKATHSSLIANGYYRYVYEDKLANNLLEHMVYDSEIGQENPKMVINGGNFDGGYCNVKNDGGGYLQINGGVFEKGERAIRNWNVAWISGGEFSGETAILSNKGYEDDENRKGIMEISGGSFTVGSAVLEEKPRSLQISGGTFFEDMSTYVVDGYLCQRGDDGLYRVVQE